MKKPYAYFSYSHEMVGDATVLRAEALEKVYDSVVSHISNGTSELVRLSGSKQKNIIRKE
jgi:hypothetical protein